MPRFQICSVPASKRHLNNETSPEHFSQTANWTPNQPVFLWLPSLVLFQLLCLTMDNNHNNNHYYRWQYDVAINHIAYKWLKRRICKFYGLYPNFSHSFMSSVLFPCPCFSQVAYSRSHLLNSEPFSCSEVILCQALYQAARMNQWLGVLHRWQFSWSSVHWGRQTSNIHYKCHECWGRRCGACWEEDMKHSLT